MPGHATAVDPGGVLGDHGIGKNRRRDVPAWPRAARRPGIELLVRSMANILLIDDSNDIRALVRLLLEQGGHAVVEADEGYLGLELARTRRPDLVLTDLALPGLSGWDIARMLKSDPKTAEIPVVALTAHAMRGDRERAIALGCDGFIVKPIDDERFEPTIRGFLRGGARRPGLAEPPPQTRPPRADPASTAEHGRSHVDRARPDKPETAPRRVLVVDDNPGVLALLRNYLDSAGFQTLLATDGQKALERVEADAPDLVVLDVMLPGLDGYEVTARIKGRGDRAFLPVVLVTAGTLDRERGLEVGADDFLGKPIERVELLTRVRSLLRLRDALEGSREQTEALRRLDRSKQRFIASVVHDLRTPLNAMALTLEALKLAPPTPEELPEDLDLMGRNIRQMDELLSALLDYSRAVAGEQPLNLAPFDPRDLARDVVGSLSATAAHAGLALRLELDDGLPREVASDYAKCRQVLFNLASNAIKYTRLGHVLVRARRESPGWWAVDVTDTGVGIAEEDLERIFEEFEQARIGRPAEAPGTGLGLAISRHLVRRLGGRLTVASEVGRGSTFTAAWPETFEETSGRG
jgi:signal transduction histidine kinase